MSTTDKQIAAGAAAIRAAEPHDSPEDIAKAVFAAMSKSPSHKERVAELDEEIAEENEKAQAAAPKKGAKD